MKKNYLLSMVLTLSLTVLNNNVFAVAIYTFEGNINGYGYSQYSTPPTQEIQDHYQQYGISAGAAVQFSVLLDDMSPGSKTVNGVTSLYPNYEKFSGVSIGSIGYSEYWYKYADLSSSSIDFSFTNTQSEYNYVQNSYTSGMTSDDYAGRINIGDLLSISKRLFQDDNAFVDYWSVGENFDLHLNYDDGFPSGGISVYGDLVLVGKEGSFNTFVPVPPSILLFGSGLFGLFGLFGFSKRKK